jgi:hypothetical protein
VALSVAQLQSPSRHPRATLTLAAFALSAALAGSILVSTAAAAGLDRKSVV